MNQNLTLQINALRTQMNYKSVFLFSTLYYLHALHDRNIFVTFVYDLWQTIFILPRI